MCQFIETIRIEDGKAVNLAFHNYRFNKTRRDVFECNLPVNLADYIQPGDYSGRTKCRVEYQEEVEKVEYLPYTVRPVNRRQKRKPFLKNMLNGRLIRFLLKLTPGLSGQ